MPSCGGTPEVHLSTKFMTLSFCLCTITFKFKKATRQESVIIKLEVVAAEVLITYATWTLKPAGWYTNMVTVMALSGSACVHSASVIPDLFS